MAITVLELAIHRGAKQHNDGCMSADEIEKVGLPFFGGCCVCGASIAAYNSCPAKNGYLKCANGRIDDDGFDSVEEANQNLFPEEQKTCQNPDCCGGVDCSTNDDCKNCNVAYQQVLLARIRKLENLLHDVFKSDQRDEHLHQSLIAEIQDALNE